MFATLKLRMDEREVENRKLGITCNREELYLQCATLFYGLPFNRPTVLSSRSQKRSSNQRNLKTPALRFSVNGKTSRKRSPSKSMTSHNHVISVSQIQIDLLCFQISPRSVNEKQKSPFLNPKGVVWTEPCIISISVQFCLFATL